MLYDSPDGIHGRSAAAPAKRATADVLQPVPESSRSASATTWTAATVSNTSGLNSFRARDGSRATGAVDEPIRRIRGGPNTTCHRAYNLTASPTEHRARPVHDLRGGARSGRSRTTSAPASRDGFHWARPIAALHSVSEHVGTGIGPTCSRRGCCLVVGDRPHFYVSGRRGRRAPAARRWHGPATLRRDASSRWTTATRPRDPSQPAQPRGTLVTRPVVFNGRFLSVNANMTGGARRVSTRTAVIARTPRRGACRSTAIGRRWSGLGWRAGLSAVATGAFRFAHGALYAFWSARRRRA